jgi:hypothetical protein
MKYTFPQFNLEIEPTKIIVDLETIRDRAISKLLCVNIKLVTDRVTYVHSLEGIPYQETWSDEDVEQLALDFLNKPENGFLITN